VVNSIDPNEMGTGNDQKLLGSVTTAVDICPDCILRRAMQGEIIVIRKTPINR
jgi:hypothetical protein